MKDGAQVMPLRAWSHALGALALAVPAVLYLFHFSSLGWPDGFLSERDRAEQDLFHLFVGASLLLGLSLFWLGRSGARRGVAVATGLFLLLVACSLATLSYFRAHLPGGGGG